VTIEAAVARRFMRMLRRWSVSLAYSNAKMRLQSFFMLITVQPFCFASSYSAWVKVPTLKLSREVFTVEVGAGLQILSTF
jgi:hypothetical protein